jgi:hypothetical protein
VPSRPGKLRPPLPSRDSTAAGSVLKSEASTEARQNEGSNGILGSTSRDHNNPSARCHCRQLPCCVSLYA